MFRHWTASLALVGALAVGSAAAAEKQYGPGVTDKEIKIGQTSAYSGPASAYGNLLSKTQVAYVRMINERGGINGRKVTLISLDDGYSPPKTVEQTRRLVEQDNVLGIFNSLGTAPNAAIQEYLNEQHVPHFAISGASRFNDPARYPWTMGVIASYETEGRIYAQYILHNIKEAKIAVLYQNDDLGKDYFNGLREGLGDQAESMIVKAVSYELTDRRICRWAKRQALPTARHHPVALASFERRWHTRHALPQLVLSEPKHSLSRPCRHAPIHSRVQRQDRRDKG